MPEKIDIPMGGLGGLLILGGAAALTYYLWPKGSAGARGSSVPSSAGSSSGSSSSSGYFPSTSGTTPSAVEVTPSTSGESSSEQLGWEAASGAGSGPTWYTPGGQTGPTWYNGLGGLGSSPADPRPVQYMQLAEQVSRAQSLVDSAYSNWVAGPFARAVGSTQNVADLVASSRALAGGLIDALRELAADPDSTYEDGSRRDQIVTSVAANYVGRVNSIIQTIGSQSAGAELLDFISRFPSSLRTVLSYTIDAAGNVVAGAAWGVGKTALILGAAVAGVALLMRRAGVSIDAGPVRLK